MRGNLECKDDHKDSIPHRSGKINHSKNQEDTGIEGRGIDGKWDFSVRKGRGHATCHVLCFNIRSTGRLPI